MTTASPPVAHERLAAPLVVGGVRLLAPAALLVVLIALVLVLAGPSERVETFVWVLAFAVALPLGLLLGERQERELRDAAPAAGVRALAIGLTLVALALVARRLGSGGRLEHTVVLAAGVGALAAPTWAARRWRSARDVAAGPASAIAAVALAATITLFLPQSTLRVGTLAAAAFMAGLVLLVHRQLDGRRLPPVARRAVDVAFAVGLAALVATLPAPEAIRFSEIHHLGFYVAPANEVLHGRPMLDGAWSQYGVGSIDWLALVFSVAPIGYGQMILINVGLMCVQYVCVYATLRLAGLGQLLAVATVAVAALGNVFASIGYAGYPSITPMRFGPPYVLVLVALLEARWPRRANVLRCAQLVILAAAAMWSFETWVYTIATFALLAIAEALAAGRVAIRTIVVRGVQGVAASVAGVLVLSLGTWALSGGLDWGPYVEYLRLYSTAGVSQLPVVFFSPGPLMAAQIFLSAAALLWLVRDHPAVIAPGTRIALAGYTGFAVAAFTYYLGRSHPNNLFNVLVPAVVIGGLWCHVLLSGRGAPWRAGAAAVVLMAGGVMTVAWLPSVPARWDETALAYAVPLGDRPSLPDAIDRLASNPVRDPRAVEGVALLERYAPEPSRPLVLTESDLTLEILLRAGRSNPVPIAYPFADELLESNIARARTAAERMPAGTLLLTSPSQPVGRLTPLGAPREFTRIHAAVLDVLLRRFTWETVDRSPGGLQLVRLDPRP